MTRVRLGEYVELYTACSRLDDARLLAVNIDTEKDSFLLELRFKVSTNPSNPNEVFSLRCQGSEVFSFKGEDFNQFMMMSGYPDSLFIRAEEGLHALYFLPNSEHPDQDHLVEGYEMKITCKDMFWHAR